MKKPQYFILLMVATLTFIAIAIDVRADFPGCDDTEYVDGYWQCADSGTSPGGTSVPDNPPDSPIATTCVPDGSKHVAFIWFPHHTDPETSQAFCTRMYYWADSCGNKVGSDWLGGTTQPEPCPGLPEAPPPEVDPCPNPVYTGGGIRCEGESWSIEARVGPPGITFAARPYPATLVQWPTDLRFDSISVPSGSGFLESANGWKNISLTLYFQPVSQSANVFLEIIGAVNLTLGDTISYKYGIPSHPAVGGDDLAGVVGQLEELAGDTPLFKNYVNFPFNLYCQVELDYFDNYNWRHYSNTKQILPGEVANLPVGWGLDLDGDGTAEAFGGGVTILRMDEAGNTNNPVWRHAYSWGGVWYHAVRQAQGQITWPGGE